MIHYYHRRLIKESEFLWQARSCLLNFFDNRKHIYHRSVTFVPTHQLLEDSWQYVSFEGILQVFYLNLSYGVLIHHCVHCWSDYEGIFYLAPGLKVPRPRHLSEDVVTDPIADFCHGIGPQGCNQQDRPQGP